MNTPSEPSLLTPAVALATTPDPAVQPGTTLGTIPDGEPVQSSNTGRRRTGKVACLPKTVRDLINRLLRDGRTYAQILTELGQATPALPYELNNALYPANRLTAQLHCSPRMTNIECRRGQVVRATGVGHAL